MKLREFLGKSLAWQQALAKRLVGIKSHSAVLEGDVDQDVIRVDLSQEHDNLEVLGWGYGFAVQSLDGLAYARLSVPDGEKIPLHAVRVLAVPFAKLYISNPAQPARSLSLRIFRDIRALLSISPQIVGGTIKSSFASYESLAAGASAVLYSDPIIGTGYLESALVSSAVPVKAEVQTKENELWTTRAVGISFPERTLEIHLRGAAIAPGGSFFA